MTLSDIPYIDDKLQEKKDSSTSKVGSTDVKSALKSSTKGVTATTSTTFKAGPKSTVGKKAAADNQKLQSKNTPRANNTKQRPQSSVSTSASIREVKTESSSARRPASSSGAASTSAGSRTTAAAKTVPSRPSPATTTSSRTSSGSTVPSRPSSSQPRTAGSNSNNNKLLVKPKPSKTVSATSSRPISGKTSDQQTDKTKLNINGNKLKAADKLSPPTTGIASKDKASVSSATTSPRKTATSSIKARTPAAATASKTKVNSKSETHKSTTFSNSRKSSGNTEASVQKTF